jgi:hypothetical protein
MATVVIRRRQGFDRRRAAVGEESACFAAAVRPARNHRHGASWPHRKRVAVALHDGPAATRSQRNAVPWLELGRAVFRATAPTLGFL